MKAGLQDNLADGRKAFDEKLACGGGEQREDRRRTCCEEQVIN
jgi:hypothetical protein